MNNIQKYTFCLHFLRVEDYLDLLIRDLLLKEKIKIDSRIWLRIFRMKVYTYYLKVLSSNRKYASDATILLFLYSMQSKITQILRPIANILISQEGVDELIIVEIAQLLK